ncbi:HNH endonuclease signature motif containing protein [Corynebacterium bovis]|uniref:HNH endonuclease signature motif containing protein n=1 Tax=Corynebacterium bovis TaxID=36808 RepID=UPI000F646DD9|nr:HNH endonuclease signature motif containing protein [Corynebacterium bovis]RRO96872.1 hypothetical protein CXF29_00840 [Corynebacterium bovis]RRQ14961.1 hypothetical protein CXF46_10005 [Corynebacterium bovis]
MDTVVTALREVTVAELRLAATLHGTGCVRLLRGRGRYDAAVMAHAGELSRRMPDLWEVAEDDGRLSVVHLHVIWTAVRRRTVRCPEATAELDLTCEVAVIELLDATEGPLSVEDLRDVLERVLTTAAPFLSAEAERRTPGVRRRGSRIIVECGDDVTAGLCMAAVRTAARRRGGSPVEAAVDLLRGSPERVTVHLHLFRALGGSGYVPGTGWVSPCTADLWAEVATRVHRHAEVPPGVDRYRPSAAVRRHLTGRDGHCRFPACRVPADRCQADHIVGYAEGGPTDPANLHCVCQHHHNLKTWFGWRTRTPDGGVTVVWTAPDGREFTTRARGPLAFLHE